MTVCMIDITPKKEAAAIGRSRRPVSEEPDASTDCVALIPARAIERYLHMTCQTAILGRYGRDGFGFSLCYRCNHLQINTLTHPSSRFVGADAFRGNVVLLRFVNGGDNRRFDRFTNGGVCSSHAAWRTRRATSEAARRYLVRPVEAGRTTVGNSSFFARAFSSTSSFLVSLSHSLR